MSEAAPPDNKSITPRGDRAVAAATHVLSIAVPVIPAVAIWLWSRSPAIKAHAKEDLNLFLAFTVYVFVLGVIAAMATATVASFMAMMAGILSMVYFVTLVIAAIKAGQGGFFRHRLIFRLF